jgi:hypothetical protein
MDITQIVIVISLIAVTGIIVACGVWLVALLKELKITVTKTNSILDDTKLITSSVATPVSSISDFVMGFKNGISVFNSLFKKDGSKKE